MKVILVYDVATDDPSSQRRLRNLLKVARKYLHHVQKSVFEGELSEAQIENLKVQLLEYADEEKDSVILYTLPGASRLKRHILTKVDDPTQNML